jgi:hypothetical protein
MSDPTNRHSVRPTFGSVAFPYYRGRPTQLWIEALRPRRSPEHTAEGLNLPCPLASWPKGSPPGYD